MSTPFEIPLTPEPQAFSIALAGVTYNLRVTWNDPQASWILDIADSSGNPLIQGLSLVTGTDLLGQYGYLNIGGQLVVQTDHDPLAAPTADNLGINSHLFFIAP